MPLDTPPGDFNLSAKRVMGSIADSALGLLSFSIEAKLGCLPFVGTNIENV